MVVGVFGINVIYRLKKLEIMSTTNTHGWFGGGNVPNTSTVDRIDFSNDNTTASPRGPLSVARRLLAATGNSNYGWFGGGLTPGPTIYSTVDRIDFSNDVATASARGPLSLARYFLAATGNSNYGWFGGGNFPAASTVDRIDFSNESGTASVRGPLSLVRYGPGATGNSNYGWFGGGAVPTPAVYSTVDRIDFSNDSSTASPRGPLSEARQLLAATGNSNYGWFGGGPISSTVDRIDFSNDSATVSVRGPLSLARGTAATGNSNYGWFGGGGPAAPNYSTVDRIDFSNDSVSASVRGPLSSARYGPGATSGQAKGPAIKLQKAGNYGWFGGGATGGSAVFVSTVDRIDFSNDSATALVRGSVSSARYISGATGNSNYGWFGGSQPSPSGNSAISTVDRIDFSNDSSAASVRGPLSLDRSKLAATGNSNYGWFGGGGNTAGTGSLSTVDRIDFSNDSATALARGRLSLARSYLAATGNSNYGWFGGGQPTPTTTASTVDRINFANDSVSASPRSPLISARYILAATGNSNYGWFGGGTTSAVTASPTAAVDRIDFSNDSATASPRGSLFTARYGLAATSNTPT